ncbi:MAG TPA: type II toxin-antitoxin system CcdA family antitoxin [Candidatus Nanoarchaeia archaeon]|nr:type II toxin-antitoxin system CcdA family antitoxin [Candidatus Nanoarchaeia archaeon]
MVEKRKIPVNLSIDYETLQEAKKFGLNLSGIADEAIAKKIADITIVKASEPVYPKCFCCKRNIKEDTNHVDFGKANEKVCRDCFLNPDSGTNKGLFSLSRVGGH